VSNTLKLSDGEMEYLKPHPVGEVRVKLTQSDNVVLPHHYARFKIEPIYFIMENKLSFEAGNVIKYVCRHDAKNGLEDLRKAARYLEMMIKQAEGNPDYAR
jgi:hypothetical protein